MHIAVVLCGSDYARDLRTMPVFVTKWPASSGNVRGLWVNAARKFMAIGINARIDDPHGNTKSGCARLIGGGCSVKSGAIRPVKFRRGEI